MSTVHLTVLKQEVVDYLEVKPGRHYLDATINGGGHAAAILQASGPDGQLIGLDADRRALPRAEQQLKKFDGRYQLFNKNFRELGSFKVDLPLDGIIADLGWSAHQLAGNRGFSFSDQAELDLRYDDSQALTGAAIIMTWPEDRLAQIFRDYGELPQAKRLAAALVKWRRQFAGSTPQVPEFVQLVESIIRQTNRLHPATKVFQALCIAVNDELGALQQFLTAAVDILQPGGRLAVISFHSLEDRMVKTFFRRSAADCLCPPALPVCVCGHRAQVRIITKKVVSPSREEVKANPRSRSAKLRVIEKIKIKNEKK